MADFKIVDKSVFGGCDCSGRMGVGFRKGKFGVERREV